MNSVICRNEQRREQVRRQSVLCGLDYLEVGPIKPSASPLSNQCLLRVYFLGKVTVNLDKSNVRIEGGRRITDIQVIKVDIKSSETAELDDYMEVWVDQPGDFSTYTLHVVERDSQGKWQPHAALDQRYSSIEFSFKTDCPSELDCRQNTACPPEPLQEPNINYLAKDYASFRQLMLDRLSLTMPEWKERHVPDIGIALVEVLAYVGDHLSYYQDAVATEAYLDTARQRISVRRHARLVDYKMHEGCNARVWVAVAVDNTLSLAPSNFYFVTRINNTATVLSADDLRQMQSSKYEIFEPMGDEEITFWPQHNKINFYTWGDKECCLRRGATSATLLGELVQESKKIGKEINPSCPQQDSPAQQNQEQQPVQQNTEPTPNTSVPKLYLKKDDVLIFEEVFSTKTGKPADANRMHRHAVRLTKVEAGVDRLDNTPVVEISWAEENALPFPLCISILGPPPDCKLLDKVSIARGNIILADHGRSIEEDLGQVPLGEQMQFCKGEGLLSDIKILPGQFRPVLRHAPLVFSQPLVQQDMPASAILAQDAREALPQVQLANAFSKINGNPAKAVQQQPIQAQIESGDEKPLQWESRSDLFSSGPDDRHFVVEMDNDGRAHLRFGDDELGEQPDAGLSFQARYRIGSGPAGNVGAGAIAHLVTRDQISGLSVSSISNPLPAQGGTAPEPLEEVKLFAPQTFRRKLERAVTAADYAAIVERDFKDKVQRAAAWLRWNGSWQEVLVAVEPYGKEEADEALLEKISGHLHRYRKIGHDLLVRSAQRVPLEIEMQVCVLPNYLRGHVKAELLKLFSNRFLSDGRMGFFHPDNLTFGEGIHLSKLIAQAQAVTGVESVQMTKMQRLNFASAQALEDGILRFAPFEIARLDNDPNFPENGTLKLDMRGGR